MCDSASETHRRLEEETVDFATQSLKKAGVSQNRHIYRYGARAAASVTCLSFLTNAICDRSFVQVITGTYQCGQEPSACSLLFVPAFFSLPCAWLCWLQFLHADDTSSSFHGASNVRQRAVQRLKSRISESEVYACPSNHS